MLLHCWWECKLVQPLWKTVWWFFKDLKTEILFNPEIPLLGIYSKEYKLLYYKNTWRHVFVALFTIVNPWNQPKSPSVIDWIGNIWHIYIMEYNGAIKRNEMMSFAGTWMELEAITFSKLTQKQKTKYSMISLINKS